MAKGKNELQASAVFATVERLRTDPGLLVANVILKNNNVVTVKNVEVSCLLMSKTGETIGAVQKVMYEFVKPGQVVQVKEINFGFIDQQTYQIKCSATDVDLQ